MTILKSSTLALACVATLAACSSQKGSVPSNTINTNAIVANKALSPSEKAEQLARAGEQLAQSSGFPLADAVLDQALSIDPKNKTAQFYKALLAQKMVLRGIAVRIQPLLKLDAEAAKQVEQSIQDMPNGALKDFILDGKADIKNENDVQAFLDEMYNAREELRSFLKNNKNSNLTIRLNDLLTASQAEQAYQDCAVNSPEPGVYTTNNERCSLATSSEIKLNRADIEAMQQIVAGVQVYLSIYNSYNLSGSIATAKKLEGKQVPSSAVYAELAKNAQFGTVRNPQQLKQIVDLGIDAIAGVRWAAKMQKELCPKGEGIKNQRSGYLFKDGICIEKQNGNTSLDSVLSEIELALNGKVLKQEINGIQTAIVPAKALTNPVADLKSLKPQFNSCDRIYSVSDASLNGVFPNNDFSSIIALGSDCSKN